MLPAAWINELNEGILQLFIMRKERPMNDKPPEEPIMQFFAFEHLPVHLQLISAPFCALAESIVEQLPRNPERTVALRKLLEAKDAAVREAVHVTNQRTTVKVPCAGCSACCRHEIVPLVEEQGDKPETYDHDDVKLPDGSIIKVLKQNPDGSCVYLGEKGCTIHDRAPAVCRWFDCRRYFLSVPRNERRVLARISKNKNEVFEEAKKRLSMLSPAEHQQAVNRRKHRNP